MSILTMVAIAVVIIAACVAGFISVTKLFLWLFGHAGNLLVVAATWLLALGGLAIILAIDYSRHAA